MSNGLLSGKSIYRDKTEFRKQIAQDARYARAQGANNTVVRKFVSLVIGHRLVSMFAVA